MPLVPFAGQPSRCNTCRTTHFFFRHTYAACTYKAPLNELIQALKYRRDFAVVPLLGRILAQGMETHAVPREYAGVVPVPLHFTDELRRGFNQSDLLSQYAAKRLNTRVRRILAKQRSTPKQVRLHRAERKKNLAGAFICRQGCVTGDTLLLVDDVFTTGATLSECAKVLKKQGGAKNVDVLVLAR